ncbi:MAG TPA: hypothetical protein VME19_11505 [Streptosporangiaceae bacterium]|nr:hypothetical protein [Streptosporangiaceae bacterium]
MSFRRLSGQPRRFTVSREAPDGTAVASSSLSPSAHDGHDVARYSVVVQISGAAALTRLW